MLLLQIHNFLSKAALTPFTMIHKRHFCPYLVVIYCQVFVFSSHFSVSITLYVFSGLVIAGQSLGYGFVNYVDPKDAEKAHQYLKWLETSDQNHQGKTSCMNFLFFFIYVSLTDIAVFILISNKLSNQTVIFKLTEICYHS